MNSLKKYFVRSSYGSFSSSQPLIANNDLEESIEASNNSRHEKLGTGSQISTDFIKLSPTKLNSDVADVSEPPLEHGYVNGGMTFDDEERKSNFRVNSSSKLKTKVIINRETIDWDDFKQNYEKRKIKKKSCIKRTKTFCKKSCQPSIWFFSLFPFFNWIRTYSVKNYLLSDIISGFTISILHIPQGMAYGILAGLGPIYGLYVSFFPVLVYVFMGSSRHVSIGTFAVISLMVDNVIIKQNAIPYTESNSLIQNATNLTADRPRAIEVLTSLCLMTGICQLLMGLLKLGALSVILSDTLVSGFSTGCSIHVATSQLNSLFDIKKLTISGPFKLIWTWVYLFENINKTNLITLGVSIVSIFILLVVKEFIEPRLKNKCSLGVPIPIDIILVIGITLFSWISQFDSKYKVHIMGEIPTGLPEPKIPNLSLLHTLVVDSLIIGIVSFAVSLSLAKIFAKKYKYNVDANQELNALGGANIISSFFLCYPCSASLSRSSVQEKAGGKTQIAGLVSSSIILVVLLFIAPLFYHLPKCILSCIILVALKSMFLQISDFIEAWRVSRLDGLSWLVTFGAVVCLDVDVGLMIGICFSIFAVLLRFAKPTCYILGQLPRSEIYVDKESYQKAREIPGIKLFYFSCALFFINRHSFKENFYKKTLDVHSDDIESLKNLKGSIHTIIIDCSSIFYIDSTGVEAIIELMEELEEANIKLFLAACPKGMLSMLERTKFFEKVRHANISPTIHDAVVKQASCYFEINSKDSLLYS